MYKQVLPGREQIMVESWQNPDSIELCICCENLLDSAWVFPADIRQIISLWPLLITYYKQKF